MNKYYKKHDSSRKFQGTSQAWLTILTTIISNAGGTVFNYNNELYYLSLTVNMNLLEYLRSVFFLKFTKKTSYYST